MAPAHRPWQQPRHRDDLHREDGHLPEADLEGMGDPLVGGAEIDHPGERDPEGEADLLRGREHPRGGAGAGGVDPRRAPSRDRREAEPDPGADQCKPGHQRQQRAADPDRATATASATSPTASVAPPTATTTRARSARSASAPAPT